MQAFGTVPEYMYNLTCSPFNGGQKDRTSLKKFQLPLHSTDSATAALL